MIISFLNKIKGLAFIGLLVACGLAIGVDARAAEITGVRIGVTSPKETRLVFDSNGLPDYQMTASTAGAGGLSVAFSNANLAPATVLPGKAYGHVAALASSPQGSGSASIAFIFRRSAKIKQVFVIPPGAANPNYRLVVDLVDAPISELAASLPARKFDNMEAVIASVAPHPAPPAADLASSPAAPSANPQTPASPPPLARRPVIVVDAGHGGSDPGAEGPGGVKESAMTLSAATILADKLRETGRYEVVLTRSTDLRLAHEERSRIARDARAELFISLHADAHADRNVRGGSVYTLSDEGTERSAREALAKGNYNVFDLDLGKADQEVGGILYDLAQRRTANESDKFAELLIAKLSGVTPLLNNTHRRGNFKVLLAPDVPAVLLELAFISNSHDEANLQSAVWRKRSMAAAADAIDAYFQQRAVVKHANNSTTASTR